MVLFSGLVRGFAIQVNNTVKANAEIEFSQSTSFGHFISNQTKTRDNSPYIPFLGLVFL